MEENYHDFVNKILIRHQNAVELPSESAVLLWIESLLNGLFPERVEKRLYSLEEVDSEFERIVSGLVQLLLYKGICHRHSVSDVSKGFKEHIPFIYNTLMTDIDAILGGDPAAHDELEIIRAYPGFFAIAMYRSAHALFNLGIKFLPRFITELAHAKVGIDIHPAAKIGHHFFIDHGTGVVIGETSYIGHHVKLYQGVTLGALSVDKSLAHTKRHPNVEDYVTIYSGATILGGETTIGHHSIIGGNVWLTESVPPYSKVYHKSDVIIMPHR